MSCKKQSRQAGDQIFSPSGFIGHEGEKITIAINGQTCEGTIGASLKVKPHAP